MSSVRVHSRCISSVAGSAQYAQTRSAEAARIFAIQEEAILPQHELVRRKSKQRRLACALSRDFPLHTAFHLPPLRLALFALEVRVRRNADHEPQNRRGRVLTPMHFSGARNTLEQLLLLCQKQNGWGESQVTFQPNDSRTVSLGRRSGPEEFSRSRFGYSLLVEAFAARPCWTFP